MNKSKASSGDDEGIGKPQPSPKPTKLATGSVGTPTEEKRGFFARTLRGSVKPQQQPVTEAAAETKVAEDIPAAPPAPPPMTGMSFPPTKESSTGTIRHSGTGSSLGVSPAMPKMDVKQIKKAAAQHKKRVAKVEMVTEKPRVVRRDIGNDGIVNLSPEVLRVQTISVDSKLNPEWQLFLTFGWRKAGKKKSKAKKARHDEKRSPQRPFPYVFADLEPFVFHLNDLPERPVFFVELWAYGRVKNSLEGSVDLPFGLLKTLVGDLEVQRERWLNLHNEKGDHAADVRLCLEFSRSNETILRHVSEGILRLVQSIPGEVRSTELWLHSDETLAPVEAASRRFMLNRVQGKKDLESFKDLVKIMPLTEDERHSAAPVSSSPPQEEDESSELTPSSSELMLSTDEEDSDEKQFLDAGYFLSASMPSAALAEGYGDASSSMSLGGAYGEGVAGEILGGGYGDRVVASEYGSALPLALDENDDESTSSSAKGKLVREKSGHVRHDSYAADFGHVAESAAFSPEPPQQKQQPPHRTDTISRDGSREDRNIVKDDVDLLFNEEWQQAVEKLVEAQDDASLAEIYQNLSDLSKKFVAVAQTYGRIIVRELHYETARKVIKPMDLGGVIGGDKYIRAGILFKVSNRGFFDDEMPSQKIAGHELKALTALFNVNMIHKIGLALPMIALLDVLGHRIIALALCPLNSKTLVHGSADAGVTILSGGEAEEKLKLAAARLNLAVHKIKGHNIPLAVDCEVHLGKDKRMYAIDLSRVLPPEMPEKAIPLSHLFRMLRPELVRSHPQALCSDAGSQFVAQEADSRDHIKGIAGASQRLRRVIIPWAAVALDQLHGAREERDFFTLDHLHRVLHAIHAIGCNFRYLLAIRAASSQEVTRQLLLVEVVSRSAKHQLRKIFRATLLENPGVADVAIADNLVQYFNACFSQHHSLAQETLPLWDNLASSADAYFGPLGREGDEDTWSGTRLRDAILAIPLGMMLLFLRINEQLGIQWAPRVQQLVEQNVIWLGSATEDLSGVKKGVGIGQITSQVIKGFGHVITGGVFKISKKASSADLAGSSPREHSASTVSPAPGGPSSTPTMRQTGLADSSSRIVDRGTHRRKASSDLDSGSGQSGDTVPKAAASTIADLISPWTFWATNSSLLFFDDDLIDAGFRVKLNNQAAMAQGYKLIRVSQETADVGLKAHFRELACTFFDRALMSNPTNPITLRTQAKLLLEEEAYKLGVNVVPPSAFWSSSMRYIDFLYKISLDSDPNDTEALLAYSLFLDLSGSRDRVKQCFLLLRALCADHSNEDARYLLAERLQELGMSKELTMLGLWNR